MMTTLDEYHFQHTRKHCMYIWIVKGYCYRSIGVVYVHTGSLQNISISEIPFH